MASLAAAFVLLLGCSTTISALPRVLMVGVDTGNDIYAISTNNTRVETYNYSDIASALAAAKTGDGMMIMATNAAIEANSTTGLTPAQWQQAESLGLRVYIEIPASLPASTPGAGAVPPLGSTFWERAVVTPAGATRFADRDMSALSLLHPHKQVSFSNVCAVLNTSGCEWWRERSEIVLARVAGYDNASFGLPLNASFPLLVAASPTLLVSTAQISHARTRRFAPTARWSLVIQRVFDFVVGGGTGAWKPPVSWVPSVAPSFGPDGPLPAGAEADAMRRGVQFYISGKLLPDRTRAAQLMQAYRDPNTTWKGGVGILPCPPDSAPSGLGQLGVLEGFTSDVERDGTQPQATNTRNDCTCETSFAFAVRSAASAVGAVKNADEDRTIAQNLLNYAMLHSGFSQPWTVPPPLITQSPDYSATRPWLVSGDAFGVLAWTTNNAAYEEMYKVGNFISNPFSLFFFIIFPFCLHNLITCAIKSARMTTPEHSWELSAQLQS